MGLFWQFIQNLRYQCSRVSFSNFKYTFDNQWSIHKGIFLLIIALTNIFFFLWQLWSGLIAVWFSVRKVYEAMRVCKENQIRCKFKLHFLLLVISFSYCFHTLTSMKIKSCFAFYCHPPHCTQNQYPFTWQWGIYFNPQLFIDLSQ